MTAPPTGLWGRLVSYAVAAAFTGLIIWMVKSPIFAVRAVDVHRADSSPPPVIDPRKIEDVVARLARGANIFRLNAGALRTAVRAQPGVADAIVAVTLDGRVTVTVSYQAPVANWVVAGQSYVVSADGHVLAARYQPDLQLTVEDTSDGTVAPGATVSADALHAAYQLQNNLPFLRVVPTRFRYAPNSLLVIDHSGREILFGSTDR
ncbi:MAG: hypothetical protein FJ029_09985, partial [Actinobacteria bacterium]|nr:hypothetical protein [Actinomycetota bacterium]